MKRWLFMILCVAATSALPKTLWADEPKSPKPQTLCPLTNDPINRQYYADHDGKRIYVCCPHCIAIVKENPQKYIRMLEAGGVTLDKTSQ